MIADLFLRTYTKDYQWLPFLFRSMVKHVRGFRSLIIVYPCDQLGPPSIAKWGQALIAAGSIETFQSVPTDRTYPNDYIGQQITKLRAWEYSNADEICYLDSDLVFLRACTPLSMHHEWTGDLLVERREWTEVGQAICWREPTAKLLGADPPFETMARHPFQYSRSMIQRCYNGVGEETALLGLGAVFSEFNLLGNWAITREVVAHVPVDLAARPDIVRQFWSHRGPGHPEVESELRALGVWEDPA